MKRKLVGEYIKELAKIGVASKKENGHLYVENTGIVSEKMEKVRVLTRKYPMITSLYDNGGKYLESNFLG